MKYVLMRWRDAVSVDEWTDLVNIDPECHLIETVGHLIYENEDSITVALSIDPEREAASNFINVPKPWIEFRQDFRVPKKRKG